MIVKPEPDAGRGGTILFVDDEPLSLKYFKASVGKYANVVTADSTDAALKILAAEGDTISVVVSDERMPRDSGVSFLSNVRKSWPSTVRILTSAYANIDLQKAINGAAIHRFVPKPWDLDELCAAMQEALHAERTGEDPSEPAQDGPRDAENANLELLAILTRELAKPLESLDVGGSQAFGADGRAADSDGAKHAITDCFLVDADARSPDCHRRASDPSQHRILQIVDSTDRRAGRWPSWRGGLTNVFHVRDGLRSAGENCALSRKQEVHRARRPAGFPIPGSEADHGLRALEHAAKYDQATCGCAVGHLDRTRSGSRRQRGSNYRSTRRCRRPAPRVRTHQPLRSLGVWRRIVAIERHRYRHLDDGRATSQRGKPAGALNSLTQLKK